MGKNTKANAAALEAQRKQKRNGIIITACVVLVAALIIGLFVYDRVDSSGAFLRSQTAVETEHFEVNGAMMAYMYSVNYNSYYSYLSMLGVDTSVSLKEQDCPLMATGTGTWFDYFVETTKRQLDEMLSLCEGAYVANLTLTDEEQAYIDSNIAGIEAEAKNYGYANGDIYLYAATGNKISVEDVRKCMELSYLADKYKTQYVDGLEYTADDREAYYAENPDTLNGVDVLVYKFYASDYATAEDGTTNDSATQSALAKAAADALAATTNAKDFTAAVKVDIENTTALGKDETEEELAQRRADLLDSTATLHVLKSELGSAAAEWAFAAEVGDTYVDGVEGATTFTVYMLTKKAYRDESKTADVRHILFSAENYEDDTKAQEVLEELESLGFTVEAFETLAAEYSEDAGTATTGGLYENVQQGKMVEEFNAWLFEENRVAGDFDIIKAESTGWHIMYYVGDGDLLSWEVDADNALANADYSAELERLGESLKFNDAAINKIEG